MGINIGIKQLLQRILINERIIIHKPEKVIFHIPLRCHLPCSPHAACPKQTVLLPNEDIWICLFDRIHSSVFRTTIHHIDINPHIFMHY